jgi:hypothetical protein
MATASAAVQPNVKIGPTKLLINGRWVDSASGKTFPTINPSTGEIITQVAESDAADVDKAVSAARAAFEKGAWRKMSASQRGILMNKFADLVEKHAVGLRGEVFNLGRILPKFPVIQTDGAHILLPAPNHFSFLLAPALGEDVRSGGGSRNDHGRHHENHH